MVGHTLTLHAALPFSLQGGELVLAAAGVVVVLVEMPRLRPQWQDLAGGVVAGVATSALVLVRHLVDEVLAAAISGDQLQRHVGAGAFKGGLGLGFVPDVGDRSEEHTSEHQSLMRTSYA